MSLHLWLDPKNHPQWANLLPTETTCFGFGSCQHTYNYGTVQSYWSMNHHKHHIPFQSFSNIDTGTWTLGEAHLPIILPFGNQTKVLQPAALCVKAPRCSWDVEAVSVVIRKWLASLGAPIIFDLVPQCWFRLLMELAVDGRMAWLLNMMLLLLWDSCRVSVQHTNSKWMLLSSWSSQTAWLCSLKLMKTSFFCDGFQSSAWQHCSGTSRLWNLDPNCKLDEIPWPMADWGHLFTFPPARTTS